MNEPLTIQKNNNNFLKVLDLVVAINHSVTAMKLMQVLHIDVGLRINHYHYMYCLLCVTSIQWEEKK